MQTVVSSLLQTERQQESNFPSPVNQSADFKHFLLLHFMSFLNSGRSGNYLYKKRKTASYLDFASIFS